MQRRHFVQGAMVLGLGACTSQPRGDGAVNATHESHTAPPPQAAVRKLDQFGLQLSTITPLLLLDFDGALAEVAEIGYRQVEFSALGFLGRDVNRIQTLLTRYELSAPVGRVTPKLPEGAMQLPQQQLRALFSERSRAKYLVENVQYALEQALQLDQKVLNLPALMPVDYRTLDQVKYNIEVLSEAGQLCAQAGVQFGYHNHDWEFKPVEGVVPMELMLNQTDPAHLSLQLDQYWVTRGAGGYQQYLQQFGARINSVHLKDMAANGDFADVGFGTLDMPGFVRDAYAAGVRYFFVERDRPAAPRETMRRAYGYLKEMTF